MKLKNQFIQKQNQQNNNTNNNQPNTQAVNQNASNNAAQNNNQNANNNTPLSVPANNPAQIEMHNSIINKFSKEYLKKEDTLKFINGANLILNLTNGASANVLTTIKSIIDKYDVDFVLRFYDTYNNVISKSTLSKAKQDAFAKKILLKFDATSKKFNKNIFNESALETQLYQNRIRDYRLDPTRILPTRDHITNYFDKINTINKSLEDYINDNKATKSADPANNSINYAKKLADQMSYAFEMRLDYFFEDLDVDVKDIQNNQIIEIFNHLTDNSIGLKIEDVVDLATKCSTVFRNSNIKKIDEIKVEVENFKQIIINKLIAQQSVNGEATNALNELKTYQFLNVIKKCGTILTSDPQSINQLVQFFNGKKVGEIFKNEISQEDVNGPRSLYYKYKDLSLNTTGLDLYSIITKRPSLLTNTVQYYLKNLDVLNDELSVFPNHKLNLNLINKTNIKDVSNFSIKDLTNRAKPAISLLSHIMGYNNINKFLESNLSIFSVPTSTLKEQFLNCLSGYDVNNLTDNDRTEIINNLTNSLNKNFVKSANQSIATGTQTNNSPQIGLIYQPSQTQNLNPNFKVSNNLNIASLYNFLQNLNTNTNNIVKLPDEKEEMSDDEINEIYKMYAFLNNNLIKMSDDICATKDMIEELYLEFARIKKQESSSQSEIGTEEYSTQLKKYLLGIKGVTENSKLGYELLSNTLGKDLSKDNENEENSNILSIEELNKIFNNNIEIFKFYIKNIDTKDKYYYENKLQTLIEAKEYFDTLYKDHKIEDDIYNSLFKIKTKVQNELNNAQLELTKINVLSDDDINKIKADNELKIKSLIFDYDVIKKEIINYEPVLKELENFAENYQKEEEDLYSLFYNEVCELHNKMKKFDQPFNVDDDDDSENSNTKNVLLNTKPETIKNLDINDLFETINSQCVSDKTTYSNHIDCHDFADELLDNSRKNIIKEIFADSLDKLRLFRAQIEDKKAELMANSDKLRAKNREIEKLRKEAVKIEKKLEELENFNTDKNDLAIIEKEKFEEKIAQLKKDLELIENSNLLVKRVEEKKKENPIKKALEDKKKNKKKDKKKDTL